MPPDVLDPLRWIGLLWLAVLGGCVGSFLNVVVYRVPRGQSLTHPPSRCPSCGHPIRWYHNLPVVGWLVLRGRCRDCGARISVRYPLVEGLVAVMFFTLAVTGPLSADTWSRATSADAAFTSIRPFWIAYAWEIVLLPTLLALALIDRDLAAMGEGRYPLRWMAAVFLMAIVLPILVPEMLVYARGASAAVGERPGVRDAVEHTAVGALAGCGCGCLMFAASQGGRDALRQSALPALVGPYVGPWVVAELIGVTLLVYSIPLFLHRRRAGNVSKRRGGGAAGRRRERATAGFRWDWPLLFFLATWAGILLAHQRRGLVVFLNGPPLAWRLGLGGGLLAAVLVYALATRAQGLRGG